MSSPSSCHKTSNKQHETSSKKRETSNLPFMLSQSCLSLFPSLSVSPFLLLYLSSANDKTSSRPLNIHVRSGILLKAITDALCECIQHIRLAKLHINIHNLLLHFNACVCVRACQFSIIYIAYFSARN